MADSLSTDSQNDDFWESMEHTVSKLQTDKYRAQNDDERNYLAEPAPNIIEFCSSSRFLNIKSIFEHKRQYQVIRDFFQYRCPICNPGTPEAMDCWDKSKTYLESELLLTWKKEYNDDICPKCHTTRAEFIDDGLIKPYNQFHAVVGMRSGKTATAAQIGAWVEHRLCTLALNQPDGRLSTYFGVLPNQPFEVTYIASSEVQSTDTIWAYYTSMRRDSPWFKRYVVWQKKQEKLQTTPVGMEKLVYKETSREITNDFIGVHFNSKNSNSSGLAGRTRIASFVDELSRFKQTDSAMSADEAYRVMENSLRTIRTRVHHGKLITWLGLMASITSPISIDDKGMELLMKADEIENMFTCHYATWEFNPYEKRELYDEAFIKDPVGTERDFGAKPPLAANPLIVDPQRFQEKAVNKALKPTINIEYGLHIDKTGHKYQRANMIDGRIERAAERYIVFDAGSTFDSFAGACAHLETKKNADGNEEYVTVFDWILRILPSKDLDVWFDSALDLVKFQMKLQKIAFVEFDRWNSVTLIQQIRNLGIRSEQKGLKTEDFIKFVADAYLGRVQMLPGTENDEHLEPPFKSAPAVGLYELERLERSIDDKKIYNPNKGKRRGYNSDDIAQVIVHTHKICQDSVVLPFGAKLRSREARLKRETVGSMSWGTQNMGALVKPTYAQKLAGSKRRW